MIKTEIGHTTQEVITVRGKDLSQELMGKIDFVDGFVLCAFNRMPTPAEKNMLNAILVIGLDHGLTPSAIVARLTYLSAPESLNGAVSAGLLGAGTRFLGTTERAAAQFQEFSDRISVDGDVESHGKVADTLISTRAERKQTLYGFGHPIHKKVDPRVASLREIAKVNGFYGVNWMLADAVGERLIKRAKPLSTNASAAMGATIADMKLNPVMGVALMLVGRCAGLIAHLIEEQHAPIGQEIWDLVMKQDPRNQIPDRK